MLTKATERLHGLKNIGNLNVELVWFTAGYFLSLFNSYLSTTCSPRVYIYSIRFDLFHWIKYLH